MIDESLARITVVDRVMVEPLLFEGDPLGGSVPDPVWRRPHLTFSARGREDVGVPGPVGREPKLR